MQVTIPTLHTTRLTLVPPQAGHLDVYADLYGNPEVMRHIAEPIDRAAAWKILAAHAGHWVLYGFGGWCVEEKQSGTIIGIVGLRQPAGSSIVEIGWIISPKARGRGYATEAAIAALSYATETVGAPEVAAHIGRGNEGSVSVARKLGMKLSTESKDAKTLVFLHTSSQVQ
ncbi:MAG: GNAT family N-acetyltransferase [Formivibrio sp.]|nr:GNAT family N-acetyltransferase [Formivibrio sp.]